MDSLSGSPHLKFKLKTLLVFVTIIAVSFAAPGIWHQVQLLRLKSYLNSSSGALEAHDRSTVSSLADSVLNRKIRFDPIVREPLPSFLWSRLDSTYVFLELFPKACSHAYSEARVTIFDGDGTLVNDITFQTGYKLDVLNAERITLGPTTELSFAIDCIPSGGPIDFSDGRCFREKQGVGVRRQYYSVIDNKPVLLRLEGISGNLMPNGVDHFMIGPETPDNFAPELIDRLKSELAERAQNVR